MKFLFTIYFGSLAIAYLGVSTEVNPACVNSPNEAVIVQNYCDEK